MKYSTFTVAILCCLTLIACTETPKNSSKSDSNVLRVVSSENSRESVIRPAFTNFDIEKESFRINPSKGDTLFMSTGSIMTIPKDCFVDANGDVVDEEVQLTYREFSTPLDFFISGIPMDYDSLGESYTFESAGMCEILAYSDNKPVFVNPSSAPNVYLATTSTETNFNLYRFDTNQVNWEIQESSTEILDNNRRKKKVINSTVQDDVEKPQKPVEPNKPSDNRYSFTIDIDKSSLPELQVYNDLKFEIHEDDKSYDPSDFEELWENVEIEKGAEAGTYIVIFSNYQRKVSYLTRPVLEGKDYDKAMKLYNTEKKKYADLRDKEKYEEENRLRVIEIENKKILAQNREIEKLNKLVEARNAEIELQDRIAKEKMEEQKRINEQNEIKYQKLLKEAQRRAEIFRSFEINSFGIWNCDRPILKSGVTIYATFEDTKGNDLDLNQVTLVYKELNGVVSFGGDKIMVLPDSGVMLWAVKNNRLYYLTYRDFQKLELGSQSRKFTFRLKNIDMEIMSKSEINNLMGI